MPRTLKIIDLYFKPKKFFADEVSLGKGFYLFLVSWCYGIYYAHNRFDLNLMKESLGYPWPTWHTISFLVDGPWEIYLAFIATIGAFGGLVALYLGGWWYRLRLRWAGDESVSKQVARQIYIYSQFVMSAPVLVVLLIQVVIYDDYRSAWNDDAIWLAGLSILPFWSCYTSYMGAMQQCELKKKDALIWFVISPCAIYLASYVTLWHFIKAAIGQS